MDEKTLQPLVITANFLGNFEIKVNDCVIGGLGAQKNKALMAYLILENGKEHTRSEVAALFWPDVPEQVALHNLRQALTVIRKAFEPCGAGELFTSSRESIGFWEGTRIFTDAAEFENGISQLLDSFHGTPGRGFAISRLKRVLTLYQGKLLATTVLADAGLFSEWQVLKQEALNRLAVEGCSLLLRYYENRGEWGEARKPAEQLVRLAPWDEDAHSRFINILLQLAQGNAAMAHYQSAERYLRDELGVEPEYQLKKSLIDIKGFFSSGRSEPRQKVPPLQIPGYSTAFIGRARELETLETWVSDPGCRVITITGPGGSGKTRLAARLAEIQNTLFADGVYFVSIAECNNPERLYSAILNAVSKAGEKIADPLEELLAWAKNRRALLILDNVENCSHAAELAVKIASVASQMVLIFTSYTRLDLVGEKVFALKGLSTREGAKSEAVNLFLSHLQHESQPESETPEFIEDVIRICSLVEGLPLAVDLAAGQIKRITSSELLAQLEENMDILHSKAVNLPERHRSITASFENCWHHLESSQQHILSTLTVFQAPFTLKAAVEVCGVNSADVRELANESLLTWDAHEYYRFHRAIKQYAGEKLALNPADKNALEQKHANFFYRQLLEDHANRAGEGILFFLKNTETVIPDVTKAIRCLIATRDWERVLRMIHPLFSYFETRSLHHEGSAVMLELAELCPDDRQGNRCRARLSVRAAGMLISIQQFTAVPELLDFSLANAVAEGDLAEESYCYNALSKQAAVKKNSSSSKEMAEKALEIARRIGDKTEQAHSLYNIGYALNNLGEITKAESILRECKDLCEEAKDWRRLARTLNIMADTLCYRGDFEQALIFYKQSTTIAVAMGNRYSESLSHNNIGTVYFSLQQYAQAEESYRKSLEICREIGDREGEGIALSNLGELYTDIKDYKNGREYTEQALDICQEIGSDWGEMSARVILAVCYRELGMKKVAQDEVLVVLKRSLESEYFYFFNRAVIEACQLLLEREKTKGLSQIIREITKDEESDEWIRNKAKAFLEQIPHNEYGSLENADRKSIMVFLLDSLLQE